MIRFLFISIVFFSLNITFGQNNNGTDTDGDGIVDTRDWDDDNDGILDVVEDRVRTRIIENWVDRNNVRVKNNDLYFVSGNIGWFNTVNSQPFAFYGFNNNYVVTFKAKVSTKAIVGFGVDENGIGYDDVDYGFYFDGGKVSVYENGEQLTDEEFYRFDDDFSIVYESGQLRFYKNASNILSIDVGDGNSFYLDTSFEGTRGRYRKAQFTNILINASSGNMDIDGDGIRNSKDLDSDGDGCNDVLEAGFQDPDNDGILGEGVPEVDNNGKVISCETGYNFCDGYTDVNNDYLDPNIQPCTSETYGVSINTVNLPSSEFDIVFEETTLEDLISGTEESEVFVDLGTDQNIDKFILINVKQTLDRAALNLRITKSQEDYKFEVFQNGVWLLLSPEFYRVRGDVIFFLNTDNIKLSPFQLSLINGVEYNRIAPLNLSLIESISVEGGSWDINGPNNFSISITPNIQENDFTWDGTQAQPGVYKFQVQIQGKIFNGQFLIQ